MMQNTVCRHCNATVPAPDDLAGASCPRCGKLLAPAETHVTAHPIAAQAIRADTQPEYQPASSPAPPESPRGQYASWDDFRANSPVVQRTLLDLAMRVLPDLRSMPRAQLPADLPPSADALGVPLASVVTPAQADVSVSRVVVQRLIALAVVGAALLALGLMQRHLHHRFAVGLFLAVSVTLLALRLSLLRGRSLESVQLWLFEHGILWEDATEVEACRFEDIADFRAMRDDSQPRFTLVPRPGVTLMLSLRSAVTIMPLAEYIEIRMASAQLLPKLERIVGGERVRFGAVKLDARGLAAPGIAAPWPQIVRVMGDRRLIFVESRNQPGWRSIRAGDVSCPMLMLALAHILIEEGQRLPTASR